jgi:hypothetical protein
VRLVLEELDVGVEEVALGDVDALAAELVDQAQDAGGDDALAAGGRRRKRPRRHRVLQHDAVQLRHVELVSLGAGGHVEREACPAEHRARRGVYRGLDLVEHGPGVLVDDLAAGRRERKVRERERVRGGGAPRGVALGGCGEGADVSEDLLGVFFFVRVCGRERGGARGEGRRERRLSACWRG